MAASDELAQLVSQKVGISTEQAKQAVATVVGFLKDKLPAPIAGQIDSFMGGSGGGLGDIAQNLGGSILGKK
jgi:hypothetical protein